MRALPLQGLQQPALGGVVSGEIMAFTQQQPLGVRRACHECGFVQVLASGQVDHCAGHRLRASHCGQREQAHGQPAAARTPH
ncbi:hypothetical protein SMJ63A_70032 [Stenotrophomonas geniculata]